MGNAIEVYLAAEDQVTREVVLRLFSYVSPQLRCFKEIPARGGEVKKKIAELNRLASLSKPVVLLTDLDNEGCPPSFKEKLLGNEAQSNDFVVNIAVDEAEAWLMADTEGFASYFKIPKEKMPSRAWQKFGGRKEVVEMKFDCKSSYFLTHTLMKESRDSEKRAQILATGKACKGKEYNFGMLPFIREAWNIGEARRNSDSLERMIVRLQRLVEPRAE